jgi:Aspartyl protease
MKTHTFKRENDDALIVLPCYFNKDEFAIALDTGASHTTIDLNVLYMEGYTLNDVIGTTQFEGATGAFDTYIFKVKKFTCLGITKHNIEIAAYDFLTHHLLSDFDGVLGLDFFNEHKFCIDFKKNLITLE